ncbi:SPOR domain-containing protein [Denitratisoma oestradiolicum]|uniref:Uncharacterized protein n=1 Tax=Denitratisoma oestradiolicum TaxID=311182 RepID=A0A6S6YHX5_9PROT|nr:SPOR domain-containing protein [Denitratisoma oestradiolicum]TWO80909.1 hypothetical protein CBW56_07080 [Denitratisoma oestradiolicum]CAB1367324.1 conserved protein of unknown function [Denitratisoma oestradiolicum]
MTKDIKPRAARPQGKNGGGTLLGVFIGLVIGVLIAFGLVWYLNKTPMPFQERPRRGEDLASSPQPGQVPPALPGKPGDKVAEKPRFEFYKILPDGQEGTPGTTAAAPPESESPAAPATQFHLQAGAFQKPADADNLKAKLAMMGVEASVQQVNVADKGTLHRVRVGPFASPEEMNRARNLLAQNGIQATVVKSSAEARTESKAEPRAETKPAKP